MKMKKFMTDSWNHSTCWGLALWQLFQEKPKAFFVCNNKNSVTDHVLIVAVETDTGALTAASWAC